MQVHVCMYVEHKKPVICGTKRVGEFGLIPPLRMMVAQRVGLIGNRERLLYRHDSR